MVDSCRRPFAAHSESAACTAEQHQGTTLAWHVQATSPVPLNMNRRLSPVS